MTESVSARNNANEALEAQALEFRYQYTPVLPEILQHLQVSLWLTTYQAGKVLVIGAHGGDIALSHLDYEQPMGLAVDRRRIAIGAKRQIHFLDAAHETLAASPSPHDGCYAPRASIYTGNILGHELAWGGDGLWVVNTLFSCLCTLHDRYSFVPRWRPSFITELAAEDRCHLNGLALDRGAPRFVTALAESNVAGGWRPEKATSGVVIDVASQATIARGLAMPHSPRVHNGRLWVLDSGRGALGIVDLTTGIFETVERLPGYVRGLAFTGQFAFVGLSKIRETAVFGGLPIAESGDELRCGIGVVDLVSGKTVAVLQFFTGVSEIFAVEALAGFRHPKVAGSSTGEVDHEIWIVPTPGQTLPAIEKSMPRFAPLEPSSARITPLIGPLNQAAAPLDSAIMRPNDALQWVNLGNSRQDLNDPEGAIAAYRQALIVDPRSIPARQNLGYLLFNQGFPDQAMAEYESLLAIDPSPMNRLLAASVLPTIYKSAEEISDWRRTQTARLREMADDGVAIDATRSLVPTSFFWAYQGASDLEVMNFRGRIVRGDTTPSPRAATRTDGRRRIGFLSAYFRDHTIGRLNIGRIERLNRRRFHVTVASATRQDDPLAKRFREAGERFVEVPRDVAAARTMLQQLELDVLVFADVGMDALCSTLAFSRMATVQVATWGHPDTTGSPEIDYFLSSDLLETPAADAHYCERLVRLSQLGVFYERPKAPGAMPRSAWGLNESRQLYLCPQTLFKFHPDFDEPLAELLARDPTGELVVIESRAPEWKRRLCDRWRRTLPGGLDRVRFLPIQTRPDFVALLAVADVVLDTPHFGGGNTSYEALAMGTPIVTMPGEFLRSRITAALYRKMGFSALIADSPRRYVELALAAAADPTFRDHCRREIAIRSNVLFEDPAEIHSLEDWLASVA